MLWRHGIGAELGSEVDRHRLGRSGGPDSDLPMQDRREPVCEIRGGPLETLTAEPLLSGVCLGMVDLNSCQLDTSKLPVWRKVQDDSLEANRGPVLITVEPGLSTPGAVYPRVDLLHRRTSQGSF